MRNELMRTTAENVLHHPTRRQRRDRTRNLEAKKNLVVVSQIQ